MLNNSFFIERPTTLGTKLIFFIFLVLFLCFRHISIRIIVSWLFRTCFHTKIVTLGKCNFRTHRNAGSSTTLIEWLMFRSNPRVTVTFPNNLLWKLWIWVFRILRFVTVSQGVVKNNPTKAELDAVIQATLKHMPAC